MPLHAFFGVWQSDLPLQLFAPTQCTLPAVAAGAGVAAPAKAMETAAMARAVPERVMFFMDVSPPLGGFSRFLRDYRRKFAAIWRFRQGRHPTVRA